MPIRHLMRLIRLFLSLIIKTLDGKLILVNFRLTTQNTVPTAKLKKQLIKLNNLPKQNQVLNWKKTRKPKNLVLKEAKNLMKSSKKPSHGPRNIKLQMTSPII